MGFFDEFQTLRERTPRVGIMNYEGVNSDFCNYCFRCRDSYLCAGSDFLEDSIYDYWCYHCIECLDCCYCYDCDLCYMSVDCQKCYNCDFCQDCRDCQNCTYSHNCYACIDLFGCVGLMHKKYCIFNRQYAPEEYFERLKALKTVPRSETLQQFEALQARDPRIFMHQTGSEAVTGDYIVNSKNCLQCFDVTEARDSMYITNAINISHCCDISFAGEEPLCDCYQIMSGIALNNCDFMLQCTHINDSSYCEQCFYSHHLFGCVGLKNREFCILNEHYSEKEYRARVREIISEMRASGQYGRWFESPFPHQDSKAYEIFGGDGMLDARLHHSRPLNERSHSSEQTAKRSGTA